MALPSTGPITMGDINVELGLTRTQQLSMGSTVVRNLFGVASGPIRMAADGRGKSSSFRFNITTNTTNANLRTLAINAGWDTTSKVEATVNSGVYVYSTTTATPGLTIDGSFPGGVELINNGYIIGMGGAGGSTAAGFAGGPAISLGTDCFITNNSYIAGEGGGGSAYANGNAGGGGGAGGGTGGEGNGAGIAAGGTPGNTGANGSGPGSGAGGGRILPGTGGAGERVDLNTRAIGGGAGGGGGAGYGYYLVQNGAAGGSNNSVGSNGTLNSGEGFWSAAGGGGWGAAGGSGRYFGGAGGKAVNLNGNSVTWLETGTRWGAIS